jgi:hypothetical protein
MAISSQVIAIRAALAERTAAAKANTDAPANKGDNASYAFWNLPTGGTSTLRFLPDGDTANDFFWAERTVSKLPFAGVVGGSYPTDEEVTVNVPSMLMFGQRCPIVEAVRPYWKDKSTEDLARAYYPKRSYIYQGFVVTDGVGEKEKPENPIRRFVINPSIHKVVNATLMDPEMEDMVTDFDKGSDFRIVKTQQGAFANYATSTFARKSRSLSDQERAAIDTHGLFNLKEFLGAEPDADGVAMIAAMVADSLAGKPFDYASYGSAYRPYGARQDAQSVPATASLKDEAPAPSTSDDTSKQNSIEILERIKERTMGKKAVAA